MNMDIIERIRPAIVAILDDDSPNGTGFLVTSDGYVITAYHVIEELKTDNIMLETSDGKKYASELIGDHSHKEESLDFAILKIKEDKKFHYLPLKKDFKQDDRWTTLGYELLKNYSGVPHTGKIVGPAKRSDGDIYFIKLNADNPIKGGVSGAPLFSKVNNAVVGVIIEGREKSNEATLVIG